MTRVDFYILSTSNVDARIEVVCKLIDKATTRGQRVFVHSDDRALLDSLDNSLWQFQPTRFIAHRLIHDDTPSDASDTDDLETVTLSSVAPARTDAVLINLSSSVPVFFSRFERTLEVVDQQDSIRLEGRSRYRFYQERGYPLQHHNL